MKKGLKIKILSILTILFGLAGLQAGAAIILLLLADLGAPQAADIYPLDKYPTTAWWVYALLAVGAIICFIASIYCDNLVRRQEEKFELKKFKQYLT